MKSEKRVKRVRRIRVENGLNKDMQAKLVILFVMVLLAFAGLGVRLITITRDNGERYKKQVLSQQKYNSITLPYKRGDILDCKGNKLATSEKVYNMIIDAKVMLDKEESLEATLDALRTCFPTLDISAIRNHVTQNPSSQYHIVKKQLTYDEISAECEISCTLHGPKNPFGSRNFPNYFSVPACISIHVCSRLGAVVAVGLIKNTTLTL